MAVVKFNISDLKAHGIEKEAIKELTERLGMSLEALDQETAAIDITPNRPDMLDIIGFARAASFLVDRKTPKEKFYSLKGGPAMHLKVDRSVKRIRPYCAAMVVKNVNLSGNGLKNLINFTEKFCDTYGRKRRKIAIGLHNLDDIVGDLTYAAARDREIVPLGSKTQERFIDVLKNNEKGIEYSYTLQGIRNYPFISDSKKTISLVPIINSEYTRVTERTKNLLVEMTSTSLNAVESAINMIACSFIDAGADVYSCEIDYGTKKRVTPQLEYRTIKLRKSKAEKTLGVYLEDKRMIGLANRLGNVAAKYGSYTLIYVPPYRLDVLNEQDVIEDIAIAYGYDKIEPLPIYGFSVGTAEEYSEYSNRISLAALGLGFTEAINPYLTNEDLNFKKMGREYKEQSVIQVAYAKENFTMLRTALLPGLMQNLSSSVHCKMPQRIFEIGKVFSTDKEKVSEKTNIGMVCEHSRANYSEMKAVIANILKSSGRSYSLETAKDGAFIDGRCARIMVNGKQVGIFGEIHPKVLESFRLEEPAIAAEIDLEGIMDRS